MVFHDVRNLCLTRYGCDEAEMDSTFDELNITMDERSDLALTLEELYGVPVPDEALENFVTLEDMDGYTRTGCERRRGMNAELQTLMDKLGYTFQNPKLLEKALTHSSYANEVKHQIKYNERQEFLGDAVLSIIVSDYLFNNYTVPEGELTKLRAAIVCEKSLDVMANKIGLGQYLRLGHGEN